MKKVFIITFLIIAGYFLYQNLLSKEVFEVKELIIVSQASGMDINAGLSPPPKLALIKGTVKNTGEKNLRDFTLKYKIGYDTLEAKIEFLPAGGSIQFATNQVRVRNLHPDYNLVEVKYNSENP